MYVFVGVLAGTVGAADNTLWRILSGAPGWAHGFKMTGMCGPKSGIWKMTLTVTLRDIKRYPYSDSSVNFDTLILTFQCSFLGSGLF